MADTPLHRWLRTPRGLLELLAITFAVAALLAGVAAWQRPFFERYVREKYPPPSATTEALAKRIEAGQVSESEARGLPATTWAALYQLWVQAASPEQAYPSLPRVMAEQAPSATSTLAERTLVAGTLAQQELAVRFIRASRSAALLPAVTLGLEVAKRRGSESLVPKLEAAKLELQPVRSEPRPGLQPSTGVDGGAAPP
ncbi:MAG: hypothetical protein QM765_42925 [Myxococcales bacterium]